MADTRENTQAVTRDITVNPRLVAKLQADVQELAKTGVQKARECIDFLKFSEGLIRRDIDLIRMQLEIKLKKLESHMKAELRNSVETETARLDKFIGDVKTLENTAITEGTTDTIDALKATSARMERKRLKFEVNKTLEDSLSDITSFGRILLQTVNEHNQSNSTGSVNKPTSGKFGGLPNANSTGSTGSVNKPTSGKYGGLPNGSRRLSLDSGYSESQSPSRGEKGLGTTTLQPGTSPRASSVSSERDIDASINELENTLAIYYKNRGIADKQRGDNKNNSQSVKVPQTLNVNETSSNECLDTQVQDGITKDLCASSDTSWQAKGTKSTSFLGNEVDLVPLTCEDGSATSNDCSNDKLSRTDALGNTDIRKEGSGDGRSIANDGSSDNMRRPLDSSNKSQSEIKNVQVGSNKAIVDVDKYGRCEETPPRTERRYKSNKTDDGKTTDISSKSGCMNNVALEETQCSEAIAPKKHDDTANEKENVEENIDEWRKADPFAILRALKQQTSRTEENLKALRDEEKNETFPPKNPAPAQKEPVQERAHVSETNLPKRSTKLPYATGSNPTNSARPRTSEHNKHKHDQKGAVDTEKRHKPTDGIRGRDRVASTPTRNGDVQDSGHNNTMSTDKVTRANEMWFGPNGSPRKRRNDTRRARSLSPKTVRFHMEDMDTYVAPGGTTRVGIVPNASEDHLDIESVIKAHVETRRRQANNHAGITGEEDDIAESIEKIDEPTVDDELNAEINGHLNENMKYHDTRNVASATEEKDALTGLIHSRQPVYVDNQTDGTNTWNHDNYFEETRSNSSKYCIRPSDRNPFSVNRTQCVTNNISNQVHDVLNITENSLDIRPEGPNDEAQGPSSLNNLTNGQHARTQRLKNKRLRNRSIGGLTDTRFAYIEPPSLKNYDTTNYSDYPGKAEVDASNPTCINGGSSVTKTIEHTPLARMQILRDRRRRNHTIGGLTHEHIHSNSYSPFQYKTNSSRCHGKTDANPKGDTVKDKVHSRVSGAPDENKCNDITSTYTPRRRLHSETPRASGAHALTGSEVASTLHALTGSGVASTLHGNTGPTIDSVPKQILTLNNFISKSGKPKTDKQRIPSFREMLYIDESI